MKEEEFKPPITRSDNWTATSFFIFAMLANCFTLNFTHERMPDPKLNAPLRDVGFDIIPIVRLQWITDSMLGYFNVACIGLWLYAQFVENNLQRARAMWLKYFMVWGYCMMMRALSIFLTSLPATENHCQNPKEITNIWYNTIMGFVTFGGKNVHCGDLLFSGHTINIVNAFWYVFTYGKRFPVFIGMTGLCTAICLFLIIASRSHYTIDVYIAFCITTLTSAATPETIPPALQPVSSMWAKVVNNNDIPPKRKCDGGALV
eukprot:TRINITY_DN5233_c3_g4_i1.p1 TRINITY_DN5233_c3_g4~~TRINITY_DN5233_c3_g4_i1.p1  ORF type:complete len:261 (+),score=24.97 TRINITY_DN5233_c3_g4_i1:89-871(+)